MTEAPRPSPEATDGDEGSERPGRLVDAPHVEPSGALMSEIRRRTQPGPG
jgi:hypothetical protein